MLSQPISSAGWGCCSRCQLASSTCLRGTLAQRNAAHNHSYSEYHPSVHRRREMTMKPQQHIGLLLATIVFAAAPIWPLELADSGAPPGPSDLDLVGIHESPKPVECSGGVKQVELAPESKIVAIHFGQQPQTGLLSNMDQNVLSARKQPAPGKQSQEFDIGGQQQQQQQESSTSLPAALVEAANNQSEHNDEPTTATTVSPSPEAAAPTSTTTTTTTTPAPVVVSTTAEPNSAVDAPVGTKTIRQGEAVFCGEANPNGKSNKRLVLDRIVGGRKTEPGEFPFQVRLNIRSRRGSGICGGVILDKHHILTAAHCMTACASQYLTTATIETSGVHATIGDHSIKSNDGEIEIDVDKITPHEKYDACNFYANDHDIALIKTSSPIEYRFTTDGYGSINRPCMPRDADLAYREGESVIVSGWGVTRENSGSLSNILRYVQVPIVNTTRCQETYGSRVTRDHVCAGYQSGGKDSCQGDSGGPLVRVVDNRYELVGIVSFGYGCGQPGAPGVYTRVASYIDWIKANL